MELGDFSNLGVVIAVLIGSIILLAGASIIFSSASSLTQTLTQQWTGFAGVPSTFSGVQTVTFMGIAANGSSTDNTPITAPGQTHTFTISHPDTSVNVSYSITHLAGIGPLNVTPIFNGHLLTPLTNATQDNYTLPGTYLVDGVNTVIYT